jgi:acyl carrier protein
MEEKDIFDEVVKIIKAYFPDTDEKSLTMDTKVNTETKVDSLGFVLIISKVEAKYNLHIPDRAVNRFVTIGDLVRYVGKKATI